MIDRYVEEWIAGLGTPFDEATRQMIGFATGSFDCTGLVLAGTIVRGEHHAGSDLDVVVLHDQPWRQRVQRRFAGVPAELFVNPPWAIRQSFVLERASGRPAMLHMMATGRLLIDRDRVAADLQLEARAMMDQGPDVDQSSINRQIYAVSTAFEDGADLVDDDPERSTSLIHGSLLDAVDLWFLRQSRWRPRPKRLLADLEALDPDLGSLVRQVVRTSDPDERIERGTDAIGRLIGASAFFEWDGDREARPAP